MDYMMDNITCPFISTSLSSAGRLGESCTFQGSPTTGRDGVSTLQHYIFGGDRNGMTFFGGIYEIDNVCIFFLVAVA